MEHSKTFSIIKESSLSGLWIHFKQIKPLIAKLETNPLFKTQILGYSVLKTPIYSIKIGSGSLKILIWSQMHGDESTATKVIFDLINYLNIGVYKSKHEFNLLNKCSLTIIPMLNPDGAFLYTRENYNKKDLNRDAVLLETPEAKILNKLIKDLKPDYAFNLHDQDSFYNVYHTNKPATFSFLAPASDKKRTITKTRKKAMSVIVNMYNYLNRHIPGQMARYNDTFCHNCFGDLIQKSGIPTILVESGHFPKDEKREITRMYHSMALLNSIQAIANDMLPNYNDYLLIPESEKKYYDIRFDNVMKNNELKSIAIRYNDHIKEGKLTKFILKNQIIEGTELNGKYFHKTYDLKGMDYRSINDDFINSL
jgi:hypothetical protein